MISAFHLKVPALYIEKRIDAYLAETLQGRFSREEIKRSLEAQTILLNGKTTKPRTLVKEGDDIEGNILSHRDTALKAEAIPLSVVYEDESIIVVDKPAGLVVHPGAGNKDGTLVNALLGRGALLSDLGGGFRPGIVHRLDKQTSGLLVVAKDNVSHRALQSQFQEKTFLKIYIALVKGKVEYEEGHICEPLGPHPKMRNKRAVLHTETAKPAETYYRVLKRFSSATLLQLRIATGRTHQIRVHMQHLGHPVVGDEVYGVKCAGERLCLHASKIEFVHPKTGKIVSFQSELPDDFKKMIEGLEKPK